MYGLETMEDKENRRYDSLEDKKLGTFIELGITIWRIIIIMRVWKIGN
jgi:hypothetical protein